MYLPIYICSVICRRLESSDPTRVNTLGYSKAVSDGSRGILQGHRCSSLCCIMAALWNIPSNTNKFHSCLGVASHPEHSFFILSRKNWDWRVWLATQLEQPVHWAYSFTLFPKIAKLPWCKVINSSSLQM